MPIMNHETLIRTAARKAAARYQEGSRWTKEMCIEHYAREEVGVMDEAEEAILEDEIRVLCPRMQGPQPVVYRERGTYRG
jgi:hypothetical protein